ncbi:hypothetical protein Tco_0680365 [Tanacetum coccineum]|uniref:Uncharacterized protein n=1 Tax=Tanacetum coccineum TaxID=301880 RepID=A0ABQ4XL83_9ASTR
MNPIAAQQVALDNSFVAHDNRVKIGKCSMRIDPSKTPKEPTYQVVLDALSLSPLYPAFLITGEVLEIYMHQFWHTITKIKNSSSYKFKLDKKKCTIDFGVFHDILQICTRLPNQEFVIDNRDSKKQEKIYYPRFTKAIIQHFISKDKSISMRNRLFMHTIRDDIILGSLIFDSKTEEYQVYGALIPAEMTNRKMRNSTAYKTYLTFATRATTPKKARKLKKLASPSKKKTLVVKKAPAKTERSKGIGLLSEAALPKKAQIKKAIKQSKRETFIHQASGSSEGADLESEGDSDDDNDDDDHQSNDERTESNDDKSVDLNKIDDEEETQEEDEFVHTPNNYLKDAEPADEEKGDEEMTHTKEVNAEHEEVSQEVTGDQVKDDAQATVTAALATQKTEAPLQSSFISSDYATKFLNFDNIPSGDTDNISIMDIKVQHEDLTTISTITAPDSETLFDIHQRLSDLENEVKTLKNVDHSSALLVAIKSKVFTAVKEYLRTSLDDTLYKKRTLFETMTITKSFNKNTKHKALYHALIESILEDEGAMDKGVADKSKKRKPDDADRDEGPSAEPDQGLIRKKTGKETKPSKKAKSTGTSKGTTKSQPKSTGKSALAEETVFEAGDTQVPHNQGDDMGPAFKILKGTCRSYVELKFNMEECYKALNDQLDWNNPEGDRYPFNLSKPLPLVQSRNHQIVPVDYFFNNDLAYLQGGSTGRTYTTSLTKTKASKYDLPGIEDMVPNLVSKHDVYSTKRIMAVTNVKVNVWYGYGHLKEIKVRRSDQKLYKFMEGNFPRLHLNDIEDMLLLVVQNRLFNLEGNVIVHLAAALPGITNLEPYTTYSNPQGVIYLDKLERNRLMYSHELYKFSDGTLTSVRDKLKDMLNNLEMGYTSDMPRRRWSNLDKKWSFIMVKDIDRQLLERRLMRSLEKFVGGRDYGEDLRMLQRTI